MDIRERLNASIDCVFETIDRFGLTKMHSGLHSRQHVLSSVFSLTGQNRDLLLAALALRNVPVHAHPTTHATVAIPKWDSANRSPTPFAAGVTNAIFRVN